MNSTTPVAEKNESTLTINSRYENTPFTLFVFIFRKLKRKKRKERIALYKQEASGGPAIRIKTKPTLNGFLSMLSWNKCIELLQFFFVLYGSILFVIRLVHRTRFFSYDAPSQICFTAAYEDCTSVYTTFFGTGEIRTDREWGRRFLV